jgi:hypothetical protein
MKRLLLCVLLAALVTGCGGYYRVTDPTSKNSYYTEDYDTLKSGAIKFRDARSGSDIILQSSEVKEVSKEEYKAAVPSK